MIPERVPLAQMQVDPIEDVIDAARRGEPIVLVDSEDRENEGDVVIVAEFATPEVIAFMARRASGLICVALTETRASELGLRRSSDSGRCLRQTAFTKSIEAREGITTGISAADRAHTIATAEKAQLVEFLRALNSNDFQALVARLRENKVLDWPLALEKQRAPQASFPKML